MMHYVIVFSKLISLAQQFYERFFIKLLYKLEDFNYCSY